MCRAQLIEALKQTSWGNKDRRHFISREEEYVGALRASFGIWCVCCSCPALVNTNMTRRQPREVLVQSIYLPAVHVSPLLIKKLCVLFSL